MRRSTLWMCALLVTTTFGCERVKKQVAAIKEQVALARERIFHKKGAPAKSAAPGVATPGTATPQPVTAAPTPPAPPQPAPPQAPARPRKDVPYVSEDTGTVAPGMSERDVYSLWGSPVAVRHLGEFTYLFFQNGCEHSCGTIDVVTLQNGQVVDALVRWPGHGYSGPTTSPAGAAPQAPAGGDMLQMQPDTTAKQPTTP